MTPKEKAKHLYNKMLQWQDNADIYIERKITSTNAKHSALIAVDEIIENQENVIAKIEYKLLLKDIKIITFSNYWNEVKKEIEKL
jgi:NurA-like 5'-3' nuclease